VEGESQENFLILLQQHLDRFQPADEVEFGMIEEMCASYWRQRRAWSLETAMFNKHMAQQPDGEVSDRMTDRMVVAFDTFAASPSLALIHRYETRLHLAYQHALRTLILLRTIEPPSDEPPYGALPNEPNPISEHSPCGAANPGCSRLSTGSGSADAAGSADSPATAPRSPDAATPAAPPPHPKNPDFPSAPRPRLKADPPIRPKPQ
jgi:hypothetical protein